MVAAVVYFFLLKAQDMLRTRNDTQAAAFASLGVDRNSSSDFWHKLLNLIFRLG
jgi:hypothetical protein